MKQVPVLWNKNKTNLYKKNLFYLAKAYKMYFVVLTKC